ncbi:MAG: helix-turn-helix domain-containing protein [Burkholderiales bacterium]
MTSDVETPVQDATPEPRMPAGARLREARESAGLTIDAVAQQLKLAPRQVQAIEDDDYAQLPGRTFVRGFMRNYARLLQLDPEDVLATLPDANAAPSLNHPSLNPTTRVMGELPADASGKPSTARWAIPLALVVVILIGVAYEFGRPLADRARAAIGDAKAPAATVAPATPAAAPASEPAPAPAAPAPASDTASAPPAPAEASATAPAGAAAPVAGPAAADATLVLVFRGTSWVEVKDGKGTIVLSTIGYPGATHGVPGTGPFDVVLGNAEAVQVSWKGAAFDVVPFIKQNVAKFTVK